MKTCPRCNNTDVPGHATKCPFCYYGFVEEDTSLKDLSQPGSGLGRKPRSLRGGNKKKASDELNNDESSKENISPPTNKKSDLRTLVIMLFIISIGVIISQIPNISSKFGEATPASVAAEEKPVEVPTPVTAIEEPKEVEKTIPYEDEYILPYSDSTYLVRSDIEGLSSDELRLARNELYARNGRLFIDDELQAYFNSCSWYQGTIDPDDYTDSMFNEYEMANKDLIIAYERELGVNGQ